MTVTIYEEVASELAPFVRNFHRMCSNPVDILMYMRHRVSLYTTVLAKRIYSSEKYMVSTPLCARHSFMKAKELPPREYLSVATYITSFVQSLSLHVCLDVSRKTLVPTRC